jgi:hypothetical protein
MKPNYIKLFLLVLVILFIIPFYVLVQGYFARYLPTFLITSKSISFVSAEGRLAVTIIGREFVGALVVAFIALLPIGYLFPKRWPFVSAVLTVITLLFLLFTCPADTTQNSFLTTIRVGEYVAVIVAYFLMALVGSWLSRKKMKSYNHCMERFA